MDNTSKTQSPCILLFFLNSHTYELSVKWASITSSPEDLAKEALLGLAVSSGPIPTDDGSILFRYYSLGVPHDEVSDDDDGMQLGKPRREACKG